MWNKWSDDRVVRLTSLVGKSLSAAEIGQAMGITRNAVIGAVHRRGITLHNLPSGGERVRVARKLEYTEKDRERWRRCKATPEARAKARDRMRMVRAEAGAKSRPPKPPKVFSEPPPAPDSLGVTLLDLEPGGCHWPSGTGPYAFCGAPAEELRRYCEYHVRLAYQPLESTSRRRHDTNYMMKRFA